ncbi:MAG: porin [Gammaproteobacteria bacterium]|nr:MAG: porin [Gammaproteobacteria bacterium]
MKTSIRTMALSGLVLGIYGLSAQPASAMEVIGKKLEIYGKANISLDFSDNDRLSPNDQSDMSLSSNSSRLGFKGQVPLAGKSIEGVYQVEQEIAIDRGNGASLASRNTFAGLKVANAGKFIVGYFDTPFKSVAGKWSLMGDSVADRRKILGAGALNGNKMNNRAHNAIMYMNKFGGLGVKLLYSTDGKDSNSGGIDDNKNKSMYSGSLSYKISHLHLAGAYEKWKDLGSSYGETTGYRLAARWKASAYSVGAIYEDISTDGTANDLDRSAWGLNGSFRVGKVDLRAEYLVADDYEGVSDSGATAASIGAFGKFSKPVGWYVVYTQTANDDNAKYQGVDGGHGDEVKTDLGRTPTSFSAGIIVKF